MKRKPKRKEQQPFKTVLKDELIDFIETFEGITDEIQLSDSDLTHFNKAIATLKEDIGLSAQTLWIPAKEMVKDGDFVDDILFELEFTNEPLGESNIARLAGILESNGYMLYKCNSLAEMIKAEAFMEDMKENPYQLRLIA